MARNGEPNLDHAAGMAVGLTFDRWRLATAAKSAELRLQFAALIPDYDPEDGPLSPVEPHMDGPFRYRK
jgi:hypothetical protein